MKFCSECGKQIPDNAKFCPYCGHEAVVQAVPVPEVPKPESPEVTRDFSTEEVADTAIKILEPGTVFNGYLIVSLLNKDPEGIKYIAEKGGVKYVLKLFFKYRFSSLETILGLQARMKGLTGLDSSHTAKVAEVNQHYDPPYMAAEYVSGASLAKIKASNPERITEDFVRKVAVQLVEAAQSVRKRGLTLNSLTLSGIMVSEEDWVTVLSSGITYSNVDEREEVFNLGVILSQLLSKNVLYKAIYSSERLQEQKFTYIAGATLSFNKILSECLHRNILQRFPTLENLMKGLTSLPPVKDDEVYTLKEADISLADITEVNAPQPKTEFDWRFYLLIGAIAAMLGTFFIFFLPKILKTSQAGPGTKVVQEALADTGRFDGDLRPPRELRNNGEAVMPSERYDPRKAYSASDSDYKPAPKTAVKQKSPIPGNFIHIPDGSFGFNRLKDIPNDNVFQDGFYMGRYEVTQAEWNQYMMPADVSTAGDKLPVDNVSWINAIRYCNARSEKEGLDPAYQITGSTAASVRCNFNANGYRLPTEAEWEMAAKAGALNAYSGSDDLSDVAWYRDNSGGRIRTGGGKQANGYGLYDMTGNVAEWCWDWYNANYPTSLNTFINPTGPDSGTLKVIRGGSVRNGEGTNIGILYREKGDPGKAYSLIGFRLVRKR